MGAAGKGVGGGEPRWSDSGVWSERACATECCLGRGLRENDEREKENMVRPIKESEESWDQSIAKSRRDEMWLRSEDSKKNR